MSINFEQLFEEHQSLQIKFDRYQRALERIASEEVYKDFPASGENAEDARSVFPNRIQFLRQIATDAIDNINGELLWKNSLRPWKD